jgi:hypothetical protein
MTLSSHMVTSREVNVYRHVQIRGQAEGALALWRDRVMVVRIPTPQGGQAVTHAERLRAAAEEARAACEARFAAEDSRRAERLAREAHLRKLLRVGLRALPDRARGLA